jgi:DsbC/DsbD-like thiol-disulfide interchange protein
MRTFSCAVGLLLLPFAVSAQKKLGEAATIQSVELKGDAIPGSRVTAIVKVQLEKGYHVHSNKPSQPEFIPTVLVVEAAAGVKAGTIAYPEGKSERVAGLPKPLSVYEDHFEISVPLGLSAAAKLPLSVPASLRYQACQGAQCYAPQKLKFDILLPERK